MKIRRFAINAYAIAAVTLLLGVVLSVRLNSWTWLSRSGSLVVINGIILTSHQIIEHMHRLRQSQIYRQSQFNRDWAGGEKSAFVHGKEEQVWLSEKYGLYMLVLGTFIWGFGDLIDYL